MTVFHPVCGRSARKRTHSFSRRTSPHRTAPHARPCSNDRLNSTVSTAAAALNSARENFPAGASRAGEDKLPICYRPGSASGVRRHYRASHSVPKCHLAPADSVGWMPLVGLWCGAPARQMVPLTGLWCPWNGLWRGVPDKPQACDAPGRPVVPLLDT